MISQGVDFLFFEILTFWVVKRAKRVKGHKIGQNEK